MAWSPLASHWPPIALPSKQTKQQNAKTSSSSSFPLPPTSSPHFLFHLGCKREAPSVAHYKYSAVSPVAPKNIYLSQKTENVTATNPPLSINGILLLLVFFFFFFLLFYLFPSTLSLLSLLTFVAFPTGCLDLDLSGLLRCLPWRLGSGGLPAKKRLENFLTLRFATDIYLFFLDEDKEGKDTLSILVFIFVFSFLYVFLWQPACVWTSKEAFGCVNMGWLASSLYAYALMMITSMTDKCWRY